MQSLEMRENTVTSPLKQRTFCQTSTVFRKLRTLIVIASGKRSRTPRSAPKTS